MSVIQIEVNNDEYAAGWLQYVLGMDRPDGQTDEPTQTQMGWDNGYATPDLRSIRSVFTRQDPGNATFIVSEVEAKPAKVKITVGAPKADYLDSDG